MRDILSDLDNWLAKGEKIALATVIQTWGSSPRGAGAKMALTADGRIAGSVSGGCVEGAVFQTGVEVLESGRPQLLHFGVADETAWNVGLACGGQIDVFVAPLEKDFYETQRGELLAGRSFAVATVVRGPERLLGRQMLVPGDPTRGGPHSLPLGGAAQSGELRNGRASPGIAPELEVAIEKEARRAMVEGRSQEVKPDAGEQASVEIFIEVVGPQPTLVVVGGAHTAIALTSLARTMGFRTIVVDPRRAFGSQERFPHVDRLIQAWPEEAFAQIELNEKTAVAMLTHDPKIDDPALQVALRSPAFYIGALGSATTQAKRRRRLLEGGMSEEELARLHGPIGLKLGAETPEEIALAIMAEIVAVQHGVKG